MTTYYPLHSLRVSLITALAFEGGVSLQALMKLAGHSRIVMTIYYAKINAAVMTETMQKAQEEMAARADLQVVAWLKERSYDDLATLVVGDGDAMAAAIPNNPKDRTSAGLQRVLGGWCFVGCNTVAGEGSSAGCWNGGKCIKEAAHRSHRVYSGVKPRHCIESGCRWFVSRPEYIPEIKARMDLLLSDLTNQQMRFDKAQKAMEVLQAEKCSVERNGKTFTQAGALDRATSLYEKNAAALDDILNGIGHTIYLLERCVKLAKQSPEGSPDQLLAVGTLEDIQWALKLIPSELLQLVGICSNAEVYTELERESESAILRRSQLLDKILEPTIGKSGILSSLFPDEQLRLGNRILRALAQNTNGEMEPLIALLESGEALPEAFRKSLADELESQAPLCTPLPELLKHSVA